MVLTRKIEVVIDENEIELKSEYLKQIHSWGYLVRNGANELISYLYSIDRLKYYKFITEDTKIALGIIGAKGDSIKEGSAPYVLLSERLKGQVPMDVANALQQNVTNSYKEVRGKIFKGIASLKSFGNIPIPFGGGSLRNFQYSADTNSYHFTLFGIPFVTLLGRDRSNNNHILNRCLTNEIKICTSALQISENKRKLFLLLSVDMPKVEISLDEDNFVDAHLSVETPIVAFFRNEKRVIGNKEEYLHRRIQIQKALKRAQVNSAYTNGGRGRKRKIKALDNFSGKEKDYINTKLHTYTRLLIDFAVKNRCSTIYLISQSQKEKEVKRDSFLLRNWGYYGLKQKLAYKANLFGIKIVEKAG